MNLDLEDRSVLVTGGSRGIGRAIVLAYAAEGARVTLTYSSNEEAATTTVKEVESRGGTATAVPMDLLDLASIERAVETATARYGGLDVVISPTRAYARPAARRSLRP